MLGGLRKDAGIEAVRQGIVADEFGTYLDDQVRTVARALTEAAHSIPSLTRLENRDQRDVAAHIVTMDLEELLEFLHLVEGSPLDAARAIADGLLAPDSWPVMILHHNRHAHIALSNLRAPALGPGRPGEFLGSVVELAQKYEGAELLERIRNTLSEGGPYDIRVDLTGQFEDAETLSHNEAILRTMSARDRRAVVRAESASRALCRWETQLRAPEAMASLDPFHIRRGLTQNVVAACRSNPVAIAHAMARGWHDASALLETLGDRTVAAQLGGNADELLMLYAAEGQTCGFEPEDFEQLFSDYGRTIGGESAGMDRGAS